jgi:flap endonuclease-1
LSNNSEKSPSRIFCRVTCFSNDVDFRAAEKAAAAAQSEDEGMSEDEPAPTSDVERPDDSDGEEKPKPKPKKKGKGKGKGKGGVAIPEEWPWEQAKKIFMEPDVLPADQVEVRSGHSPHCAR